MHTDKHMDQHPPRYKDRCRRKPSLSHTPRNVESNRNTEGGREEGGERKGRGEGGTEEERLDMKGKQTQS